MAHLDLRDNDKATASIHYGLDVNGQTISYAYIRKNACSAFKRMFQALSLFQDTNAMRLMSRHHQINLKAVRKTDLKLCVLRDPEDRIRSLYRNKFIQRAGHHDIFSSYANITGRDPTTASYRDFVTHYLSRSLSELDPHTHTQMSSLMPVRYNCILKFTGLSENIAEALGADIAERFFIKPINSTSNFSKYSESVVDTGANILAARHIETKEMPDDASLSDEDLSQTLAHVYADDLELLARVRTD